VSRRTRIDFGTVLVHSSQIQHFELKNCGTVGAAYTIQCDQHGVKIDPESGVLPPNGTTKVSVSFRQNKPEDYSFEIVELNFGALFFGQKRSIKV
jgi:hypothetical protein